MKYNENYSVVILAGGLGTRLRSVVADKSKVMAPIAGKPFLEYQLNYLQKYNITKVYLCVSYMKDSIMDYFGNNYHGLSIEYLAEEQPLGTWGAVRNALLKSPSKYCIVLNGDSYCPVDINELISHHQIQPDNTIVASKYKDTSCGQIIFREDTLKITQFIEKSEIEISPWANAGIYVLSEEILDRFSGMQYGSIEYDIFPGLIESGLYAYKTDQKIKDIGTPERLAFANQILTLSQDN